MTIMRMGDRSARSPFYLLHPTSYLHPHYLLYALHLTDDECGAVGVGVDVYLKARDVAHSVHFAYSEPLNVYLSAQEEVGDAV